MRQTRTEAERKEDPHRKSDARLHVPEGSIHRDRDRQNHQTDGEVWHRPDAAQAEEIPQAGGRRSDDPRRRLQLLQVVVRKCQNHRAQLPHQEGNAHPLQPLI